MVTILSKWIEEYYNLPEDENLYYALCTKVNLFVTEIGAEKMYDTYIEYLSNDAITASDTLRFANAFFALGLQDFVYVNPYKLIALLYQKTSDILAACLNDCLDNPENLIWSISVSLVQKAGLYTGVADEYEPLADANVLHEMEILKSRKSKC